jgi:hypothetical protein
MNKPLSFHPPRLVLQALLLVLVLAGSSCVRNRDYIYLQNPSEQAYWETSTLRGQRLKKAKENMRMRDSSA